MVVVMFLLLTKIGGKLNLAWQPWFVSSYFRPSISLPSTAEDGLIARECPQAERCRKPWIAMEISVSDPLGGSGSISGQQTKL